MEAEAEAEAVKKILKAEAEAIKIYRFHRFQYPEIWGGVFLFFIHIFMNWSKFKAMWDFRKAEAEAAILEMEVGKFQNSGSGSRSGLILK